MKILAFGDSNTWGYDPRTGGRYAAYWTKYLQKKLRDTEIINEGLCGRTAAFDDERRDGLNGLKALPGILREKYDFAVMMLGTNDCKTVYNADAQLIGSNIARCIDVLSNSILSENILLVSPILLGENVHLKDRDFDERSVRISRELKAIYSKIAKEKGTLFLASENYVTASDIDDEHFTPDGHEQLAEAVHTLLKQRKIGHEKENI